jgi:uncharacterized protein (TIGR02246 family)
MPDRIEARLQALEDREAIREIIASYGPLADSGDAQGVAGLFSDDGSYAVGGMGEARGRDAIAGLIDGLAHRELMAQGCAHLLGPVAIDLDCDHAVARGHSVVLRQTGAGFDVFRVSANRWEFARIEGAWQVTRRDNALLNGNEAAQALLSPPIARHRW